MNGADERVVPGNALSVSPDLPYHGLQQFGVSFLNKLEGAQLPSPVLRNISIVDTPGILSGEKQRLQRGYDFTTVCGWFAERADLILLLFDAHKLDISDEFRTVIESLKGQDDKIRCVLNKADQVDRQKLMRVYGALMWAMGKVTKTPEVLRVYTGSFWDQPLLHSDNAKLFELEEKVRVAYEGWTRVGRGLDEGRRGKTRVKRNECQHKRTSPHANRESEDQRQDEWLDHGSQSSSPACKHTHSKNQYQHFG